MSMKISERIKKSRNILGITQAELGKKIGVSDVSILRWEKGIRVPNASIMPKLAEALNTSVEYLMGLNDDAPQMPQINLPINNAPENKNSSDDLDLGFWGNVVERAERVAHYADSSKKALIGGMLRMAAASISGQNIQENGSSINAYYNDNNFYRDNVLNVGATA